MRWISDLRFRSWNRTNENRECGKNLKWKFFGAICYRRTASADVRRPPSSLSSCFVAGRGLLPGDEVTKLSSTEPYRQRQRKQDRLFRVSSRSPGPYAWSMSRVSRLHIDLNVMCPSATYPEASWNQRRRIERIPLGIVSARFPMT